MSGLVILGATCVLLSADTELRAEEDLWRELTTYEIVSEGVCRQVDVRLPPGVQLEEAKARLTLWDDTRRKAEPRRWETLPRGLDDEGLVRLHVPELDKGDSVRVQIERVWPVYRTFRWRPGLDDAVTASLKLPKQAQTTHLGDVAPWKGTWYADEPEDIDEVRVHPMGRSPIHVPAPGAQGGLSAEEAWAVASQMTLLDPGVDGEWPLWGEDALERGAVDPRGFAETLAHLALGGKDRVEVGAILPVPTLEGDRSVFEGDVAVWLTEDGPVPLIHPNDHLDACQADLGTEVVSLPAVAPAGPPPEPQGRVRVRRHLELIVPGSDPLASLYPGGGSSVRTTESLTFPPSQHARPWLVPTGEVLGTVTAEGDMLGTGATVRVRPDAVVVVAPPQGGSLVLTWESPDAPTWGLVPEIPGADVALTVDDPEGEIRWERDEAWVLLTHAGQPVLPSRDHLVWGLERRFAGLSIPEPGMPSRTRAMHAGWDLAEQLRPTLLERVRIAELPGDPLWPRPLHKARNSGVVTSIEAALILRLYAMQSKLAADWVLVRPADLGPDYELVPTGWTEGLVRVHWQEQTRWIDPGCASCGPFEIRPHLEGAHAIGLVDQTPPPSVGAWDVRVEGQEVRWTLAGPPALLLRQEIRRVPQDLRSTWLGRQLAGQEGELLEVAGLATGGHPIRLSATGSGGVDPLDIREDAADGWVDWVGTRTLTRPGQAEPLRHTAGPLEYRRQTSHGEVTETLTVRERAVNPAQVEEILAQRER